MQIGGCSPGAWGVRRHGGGAWLAWVLPACMTTTVRMYCMYSCGPALDGHWLESTSTWTCTSLFVLPSCMLGTALWLVDGMSTALASAHALNVMCLFVLNPADEGLRVHERSSSYHLDDQLCLRADRGAQCSCNVSSRRHVHISWCLLAVSSTADRSCALYEPQCPAAW